VRTEEGKWQMQRGMSNMPEGILRALRERIWEVDGVRRCTGSMMVLCRGY
jgi:hypothetical protein